MARGLSELQKHILTAAYQNRIRENRGDGQGGADIYTAEIKHVFYKFPARYRRSLREDIASHHFVLQGEDADAGDSQYKSASVAISKAFASLERRGLAIRYQGAVARWSGIQLTADGIRQAELLANITIPDDRSSALMANTRAPGSDRQSNG